MLNYRLGRLERAFDDLERYVSAEESRTANPGGLTDRQLEVEHPTHPRPVRAEIDSALLLTVPLS